MCEEVVRDQPNLLGSWVVLLGQPPHVLGDLLLTAPLSDPATLNEVWSETVSRARV